MMPRHEQSVEAAIELAPESLTRALAYVYAALDEVGAAERTASAARAQVAARTPAHEELDDAVELMRRARALLRKLLARDR
jgi:hypothetical protein